MELVKNLFFLKGGKKLNCLVFAEDGYTIETYIEYEALMMTESQNRKSNKYDEYDAKTIKVEVNFSSEC
jgi:hypothetical protein